MTSLRQRWNIANANLQDRIRRLGNPTLTRGQAINLRRECLALIAEKDKIAKEGFNEFSDEITPGTAKLRFEWKSMRGLRSDDKDA